MIRTAMNRCPSPDQLLQLLEEALEESGRDEAEAHIEDCVACQLALEQLTRGVLAPEPMGEVTTGLAIEEGEGGHTDPESVGPSSGRRTAAGDEAPAPDSATITFARHSSSVTPTDPGPASVAMPGRTRVAGYELLSPLGEGGMGIVYRARQERLDRIVALKMIRAGGHAGDDALERFRGEAQAVASLRHPNIVQIYEVGEADGLPFFSLELLEGGCLKSRIAGVPQPPRDAARLASTLARAVAAAHRAGIIHRDLKPANVLFDSDGVPKITDFGLAKRLEADVGRTQTGQLMGTPSYMAPEQACGDIKATGPRADIYALGVILYEMLTGRPPLRGASTIETLRLVREAEPVPPSRLVGGLSRDLETICLKCLEKDPARRYDSAEGLADDLDRFLEGRPIRARRTPAWERALKWARRRPVAALGLALGLAATAGLVAALLASGEARRREVERLARRRGEVDNQLFLIQQATPQEAWEELRSRLARIQGELRGEPKLADLADRAAGLMGTVQRGLDRDRLRRSERAKREADRSRLARFLALRDEAFWADVQLGPLAGNPEAVRRSARLALAVFASDPRDETWTLGPLPPALAAREAAEVRESCSALLLVLAGAVARPPAGEGAAERAASGLRVLDRAESLHPAGRAENLQRAALLAQAGDSGAADRARRQAEREAPVDALGQFLCGRERLARKEPDLEGATRSFEAVLATQHDHFWAQALLAYCQLLRNRAAEAKGGLNACLQRRPDDPNLRMLRALAYGQVGAAALAEAARAPSRAESLREEAEAQFLAADADYRAALEAKPDDALRFTLLNNRGTLAFQRGRYDDAEADFRAAARLRPDAPGPFASLAQVALRRHQPDAALDLFTEAIRRSADPVSLYRGRALARLDTKNAGAAARAAAMADLEEAIRRAAPGDRAVATDRALRAKLLLLDDRDGPALAEAEAALEVDPGLGEAHHRRVLALARLGRRDALLSACDQALARSGPSAEIYEIRGLERARRKDHGGAVEDFTRALSQRPNWAPLLARRGWSYLSGDAPRLARRDFDDVLRLNPRDPDALVGRALARALLGERRPALADVDAALREGGRTPRLLYDAARACAQAGRVSEADASRLGWAGIAEVDATLSRAVDLLSSALLALPPDSRASFWREVVQGDEALRPLRRRPKYAALAETYTRRGR